MSLVGKVYQGVYEFLCGRHPYYRPWHFQWLFLRETHSWQRRQMKKFKGRVLDVGCGQKPYANWITPGNVCEYIGLDVNPGADITVNVGEKWPVEDKTVDCILLTQVMEHLGDPEEVIKEMKRVLKIGGIILVTAPFLHPAHGLPYDYTRYTQQGITNIFSNGFKIIENTTAGGFGTVMASLILTWIDGSMNANTITRILKGILLPVWLLLALTINLLSVILDFLDFTNTHYANVCVLVKKL